MRISDWSSDVCSSDLTDIAVESDALDPEFLAEVGNGRVALGHSSLSEPHLGLGEGELAATLASPRAGSGQASHGALADHIPLKLRQCGKNAEHHPARWRRGVDLRALAGEHPQTNTAIRQILHRADKVGERSAEPVELPNEDRKSTRLNYSH